MVYYYPEGQKNPSIWDNNLKENEIRALLDLRNGGQLGEWERVFLKYLDKESLILDAGCGAANLVQALNMKGYSCIGIDNSLYRLRTAKRYRCSLPIAAMDIRAFAFGPKAFGGCISLGVIEHFEDGLKPSLSEAWRILKPGGVFLASVPHFTPLRSRLAIKGKYKALKNFEEIQNKFYQFTFDKENLISAFSSLDWQVLDVFYSSVVKGIKDEIPVLEFVYKIYRKMKKHSVLFFIPIKVFNLIFILLENSKYLQRHCSHMIMIVAQKKVQD